MPPSPALGLCSHNDTTTPVNHLWDALDKSYDELYQQASGWRDRAFVREAEDDQLQVVAQIWDYGVFKTKAQTALPMPLSPCLSLAPADPRLCLQVLPEVPGLHQ